jgi:hypothetical protein
MNGISMLNSCHFRANVFRSFVARLKIMAPMVAVGFQLGDIVNEMYTNRLLGRFGKPFYNGNILLQ